MTTLTVLVVEDDAMIGMLLSEMLQDMGYKVCAVAATEDDAVAQAERCKPELMIVDERLRQGSGQSAVARILKHGPLPCVFISSTPIHPARPGAAVLQKPFFEEDLVRAIRQVVGGADGPVLHGPATPHSVLPH